MSGLEHGAELFLRELGGRVHRRHVRASAAEDAEGSEAPSFAMERDARSVKGMDDGGHIEVARDRQHAWAELPDRVHDAERIGRVSEVSEVPREDCPVGFAKRRTEPFDGLKRHVNVTEADQSHRRASSCRPTSLQRCVPAQEQDQSRILRLGGCDTVTGAASRTAESRARAEAASVLRSGSPKPV